MSLHLSIVVPTFNEAANVGELCSRLARQLGESGWEVLFVDDDSPDGTAALVRRLAEGDQRVRCLQRIGRRGLSTACIEGMMAAAAPFVAVMDGDLQHDESVLPRMLQKAEEGADVVVATRYAVGGDTGEWDITRLRMSRVATRLASGVLHSPTSDPMSGFFLLRRDVIEDTVRGLSGLGFKLLLDVLATARRPLRVAEVPYTFRPRVNGCSKLDHAVLWEFGMLLADKAVGRYVPVRFVSFALVGSAGVLVHMAVLSLLVHGVHVGFEPAQASAALVAMVGNFSLNNALTYRDRRRRGRRWLTGLVGFMLACSLGLIANVGVAEFLFESNRPWLLAGLAGGLVSLTWNYTVTQMYTWRARP